MRKLLRPAQRFGVIATAAGACVMMLLPQAAFAAVDLGGGGQHMAKATTEYNIATRYAAWSAVATYSAANWNVSLFESYGPWLASSTYPTGQTEFVAINSHLRPLGPYKAEATKILGTGLGYTQFKQAAERVTLPWPANDGVTGAGDPDLAFAWLDSRYVVNVFDIYLRYGEAFWVNSRPDVLFYFLESNPANPATFIRSRAQSVSVPGMRVVGNCTLYTANHTGWHGLLMVSNSTPQVTTPASGIAVALHRLDPARPNTCPQRFFPDYTPPGP